jgi:hypothetical protein
MLCFVSAGYTALRFTGCNTNSVNGYKKNRQLPRTVSLLILLLTFFSYGKYFNDLSNYLDNGILLFYILKLVLFRQDGGTPTTSKPDWRLQFD